MKNKTNLYVLMAIVVMVLLQADSLYANWLERPKLTASDGAANQYFGWSVSISGDYAIVGVYQDDDKGTDSGSAYIYKHNGTAWIQQVKLLASDGAAGDRFGRSVSLSGNYAIVGAYCDDDKGMDSGSAYIFRYDGTTWNQQQKLTASDGAASDGFGYSASISGDYALVGAYGDDDKGNEAGSAYIFKFNGTAWSQQAKLTSLDGAASNYFGWSVSISGDYAIIAAVGDDDMGLYSGSSYIFKRDGTTWSQQTKLTASDGEAYDQFGDSVSISGNYAIVGAYEDNDKGYQSGSAYIFRYNGISWSQQVKLTASDGAADDRFGCSVSISGDYAIVGAYLDDDKGNGSGSAYIFKFDGTTWSEQAKLTASDGAAGDAFGYSVSISGDYVIVGAIYDDDKGADSGSSYIYFRTDIPCWYCSGQLFGDTNGDGKVNSTDYFNFKKAYGTYSLTHPHGTGFGQYNCCCDFNQDLRVNSADYFIFKKCYGLNALGTCSDISCP